MESLFDTISRACHGNLHLVVNGLWLSILLTAGIGVAFRYVRSLGAATRYALLWGVLVMVVAMPLMIGGTPSLTSWFDATNTSMAEHRTNEVATIAKSNTQSPVSAYVPESPRPSATLSNTPPVAPTRPVILDSPAPARSVGDTLLGLLPVVLCSVWLAISLTLLTRVAVAYRQVLRIKNACVALDDRKYDGLYRLIHRHAPRRLVNLAVSDEIDYPVAAGFGRPAILIPSELLEKLSRSDLEAVVLHELAHVVRRDDWGVLIQRIMTALLFFHPAVLWVARQMELEREIACDDWVITQTGAPGDYARCLTRLVQLTTGAGTSLVPGALTGKKRIFKRFENIMNSRNRQGRFSRTRFVLAALILSLTVLLTTNLAPVFAVPMDLITFNDVVGLIGHAPEAPAAPPAPEARPARSAIPAPPAPPAAPAAFAAPAAPAPPAFPAAPAPVAPVAYAGLVDAIGDAFSSTKSTSVTYQTDDSEIQVTWKDGRHRIILTMHGDIEFTDDDQEIASMAPEAYLTLSERRGRSGREIEVTADDDGQPVYEYFEDRDPKDFDQEAQDWLSTTLLDVLSNTAVGAPQRARRIYERDGVDGMLKEVRRIDSDYVRKIYLLETLRMDNLSSGETSQILGSLRRSIDSDYEKAELLIESSDLMQRYPELVPEYIDAVRSIDSDYEMRRALSEIRISRGNSTRAVVAVLEAADHMDSDYEKAELLISLAPYARDNDTLQAAYIRSLRDLTSDYEKRRTLDAVCRRGKLDPQAAALVLEMSRDISSDYERAELLIDRARDWRADPVLMQSVLRAAEEMTSDYETRRVLAGLGIACDADRQTLDDYFDVIRGLSSDYESAEILIDWAECAASDRTVRRGYLLTLDRLSSDYERKRTLAELFKTDSPDDELFVDVIPFVENITSDYDKRELLSQLIHMYRGKKEIEDRLLESIDEIDSDYDRGSLLDELYGKSSRRKYRTR